MTLTETTEMSPMIRDSQREPPAVGVIVHPCSPGVFLVLTRTAGVSDTLDKNCSTSTRWTLMAWHNYLPEKLLSPQHPETANQVTTRHCSCRVSGAKMRNDNRGTDFLADSLKIFWGSVSFDKNPLHTSLKENLAADHPSVSDRSM